MKKNPTLLILLLAIFIVSCSKETISETNSIDTIIDEISEIATNENKVITYEILSEKDGYSFEKVNLETSKKFITNFEYNFSAARYSYVTIECSDGTTTTCNADDGGCVGAAVRDCLDAGGCATVCRATVTYFPKKGNK